MSFMSNSISDSLNSLQALRSFQQISASLPMQCMKTIAEIRLVNLELLISEFKTAEAVANKANTNPVYLSQIRNRTPDSKTKRPREIGEPLARKLELACGKERGWMDHEHPVNTYRHQRIKHAVIVMEHMEDWQLDQAVKIVDTIAEPAKKQGNGR